MPSLNFLYLKNIDKYNPKKSIYVVIMHHDVITEKKHLSEVNELFIQGKKIELTFKYIKIKFN